MAKQAKINKNSDLIECVTYARVSTTKQMKSGLGIDDQKRILENYVKNNNLKSIGHFQDDESGKNDKRKGLDAAIKLCQATGAKLVIAKLDRLSRRASFVLSLNETSNNPKNGFEIVFCDNPKMDKTMLGVWAIFAEYEHDKISERQKASNRSKRILGKKLGNGAAFTKEVIEKAIEVRKENRATNEALILAKDTIKDQIKKARSESKGLTASDVVKQLQKYKIKTMRGMDYALNNVRPLIKEVLTEMGLTALPSATPTPSVKKVKNDTATAKSVAMKMRANNKTFQQIADFLNENGFLTAKNKKFEPITVKRLIEK